MFKDILIKYIKHYKYAISIGSFVLINFWSLDNLPWGDDHTFIFTDFIKNAQSPFVFWDPRSVYFKSWSLSYSILWSLLQIFGDDVFFFRFLNLSLHIANAILIHKLAESCFQFKDQKNLFLVFLLFLFNPISLMTINWIFQIKTLLSLFFGLLTLYWIHKKDSSPLKKTCFTILFYFLAINSKIAVVILPIYLLSKYKNYENKKHFGITVTIMLLMSTYYGLVNIKGINAIYEEKQNTEKSVVEYKDIGKDESADIKTTQERYLNQEELELTQEMKSSLDTLGKQISNKKHLTEKILLSFYTFGRYFSHTIGITSYSILYEQNLYSLEALHFLGFAIIGFLILYLLISRGITDSLKLTICFFIPISGFFYVTYMKISYISDHWFYLSLPFMLMCLINSFPKKIMYVITAIVLTQSIITSIEYSSSEKLIASSFAKYNNRFAKEYLVKQAMYVEDYENAYKFTKEIAGDFTIKKDQIATSAFVLNTRYLNNEFLWDDVKTFLSMNYSNKDLDPFRQILPARIKGELPLEKRLLLYMYYFKSGFYNEEIYQDVSKILAR